MSPLPCPCCGQMTAANGVRINAIASARASVHELTERLRRLAGDTSERGRAEWVRASCALADARVALTKLEEQ